MLYRRVELSEPAQFVAVHPLRWHEHGEPTAAFVELAGDDREAIVNRIIAALIADIEDRAGLKWEWEKIEPDIMTEEIIPAWRDIIVGALE